MFLMIGSRPDICYAISYLSRFQDKATDEHWTCLKRVLRYVKGTTNYGLVYRRSRSPLLEGFCDADWANDTSDRKSTSGYLFKVAGNVVSWNSKKQSIVVTSSTEAEFISAVEATKEAIWFSKVFTDLQLKVERPIPLYEDNMASIYMSKNPETKRMKHIDVKFHYLRERVWDGNVKLVKVPTTDQLADCLTKRLDRVLFQKFRQQLGINCGGVSANK